MLRIRNLLARPKWLAGLATLTVIAVAGGLYWLLAIERTGLRPPDGSTMIEAAQNVSLADVRRTAQVGPHFVKRIDVDLSALSPAERKRQFILAMLPLVARENDRIRAERKMLTKAPDALPDSLYARYATEPGDIATLRRRVDIVPASLVIAQAALESGWGTSRFALNGNNLFGMRTYKAETKGIAPTSADGFKLIHFDTLGHGVEAYMRNLNTHAAYRAFRDARIALRRAGNRPTGTALTALLTRYSEIPQEYAKRLRTIISREKLAALDHVRLARGD